MAKPKPGSPVPGMPGFVYDKDGRAVSQSAFLGGTGGGGGSAPLPSSDKSPGSAVPGMAGYVYDKNGNAVSQADFLSGGTGGTAPTPTPTPTVPPPPEGYIYDPETGTYVKDPNYQPDKPTDTPAPGYEWTWNGSAWTQTKTAATVEAEQKHQNDLFTEYKAALEQFGFTGAGVDEFLKQSVKEDWNNSTFKIKMRQQDWYLANPLYAANLANARNGKLFLSEGEVIGYATEAKRLAKQFGYKEPSDNYIAMGLEGGLSKAELEHRYAVDQRVKQFGGGVAVVYNELMGGPPTEEDLWRIFNNEIATEAFDDKARQAEMRGRPFTLGLGIRSEAEARALEMMGVSPDEAFSRYSTVSQNASRFARFQSIEDLMAQGLPENFGIDLSTQENSTLLRAFLAPGTPEGNSAMAQLQEVLAREMSRWKQQGTQATQGQLLGLLNQDQKQTYG